MEIMAALIYSILPCPMGCFLSGFLPASLVPIMVIVEDKASLRLLTASRMIAMELERSPTNALNAARRILVTIPIMPVFTIVFSLSI